MTALPAWIVSAEGRIIAATVKRKTKASGDPSTNGKPRNKLGEDLALIPDLMAFIRRYVVMDEAKLIISALWAIHTHCAPQFEQTPYLAVTSPEKQCGKSRFMEVMQLLVYRPWMTILPTEAVVFRKVHNDRPTLLLDETDAIFQLKNGDKYEGLRAMLNAGHRNGATVPRCIGAKAQIANFRVYCPKMLAGIGTLPDTVADRAVPIRLQRKTRDETVKRFFKREAEPEAERLVERIEAFVDAAGDTLGDARPAMPEELSDRMQEGCEPLIAIADRLRVGPAGRDALVELLSGERLDSQETVRLRLLRDLKTIFDSHPARRAAFTESLLDALHEMEESGWQHYYGHEFDARDLSNLLRHYDVQSTTVRQRGVAKPRKGYKRDRLEPVWARYLG